MVERGSSAAFFEWLLITKNLKLRSEKEGGKGMEVTLWLAIHKDEDEDEVGMGASMRIS